MTAVDFTDGDELMTAVAASFLTSQQESINFNQPTSENSIGSIAALANALRYVALPVGSIVDSLLTESQFQSQNLIGEDSVTRWVLADGRSVSGSAYTTLTGNSTVPDFRGVSRRAKNNGRSDGNQNPDGDLTLGQFTTGRNQSHDHTIDVFDPGHLHVHSARASGGTTIIPSTVFIDNPQNTTSTTTITSSVNTTGITAGSTFQGGGDTAPSNITVNTFIRVN